MDPEGEGDGLAEESLALAEEMPQLESNLEHDEDLEEDEEDEDVVENEVEDEIEGEEANDDEEEIHGNQEAAEIEGEVEDNEADVEDAAESAMDPAEDDEEPIEAEEEYENEGNPVGNDTMDTSNEDEEAEGEEDEVEHAEDGDDTSATEKENISVDVDKNVDAEETAGGSSGSAGAETKRESMVTRKRTASISSSEDGPKRKVGRSASNTSTEQSHDKYCWVCHKDGVFFQCKICPRSYHMRCMSLPDYPESSLPEGDGGASANKSCICPECVVVMSAENVDSRSEAMKMLNMDQLMSMLKYICGRMRVTPGADPFLKPVLAADAADYYDYIVYPMDVFTLEKNIKQRQYGSTEAFLADAQWLVHNSIVFNSSSSPYTAAAKRLLKVCKQELSEIETCPECYTNAHTKTDTWFIEACKRPHILVWAKLKGFPFWPAKAMKVKEEQVDVRFFGQHDRAWVSMKDCYLYSEEMPASPPKKNGPLLSAIEELNAHVEKLQKAYGKIVFSEVKTHLGTSLSIEQIRRMLPEYHPEEPSQQRSSAQVTPKPKPQSQGKSPMTITISSIKTNPTIVSNSVNESAGKPVLRSRKVSVTPIDSIATIVKTSEDVKSEDKSSVKSDKDSKVVETNDNDVIKEPEESTTDPRVPSGEILANALGLRRIVRKSSKEGASSPATTGSEDDKCKAVPVQSVERRITRGNKSALESGDDSRDSTSVAENVVQMTAKKSAKIDENPITIKGEPVDSIDEVPEDFPEKQKQLPAGGATGPSKTQNFMDQISSQAQTKPGYRFNISKDISISAVEKDDEGSVSGKNSNGNIIGNNAGLNRARKSFGVGSNMVNNANLRVPPVMFPQGMQVTGISPGTAGASPKPRLMPGSAESNSNLRFVLKGGQFRSIPRQIPKQMPGNIRVPLRMNSPNMRPMTTMMQMGARNSSILKGSRDKDASLQHQPIVVDSTSLRIESQGTSSHYTMAANTSSLQVQPAVSSSIQVNQVQSLQGAITLPGGTITVTPLTSLIAGVPITSTISSYGTTTSNVNVNGGTGTIAVALKSNTPNSPANIGLINVQQNSGTSNGLPISLVSSENSPAVTATPMNTMGKLNKNQMGQRRSVSVTLPPSVSAHMQLFSKNLTDLVKSTVEQIAFDIAENGSGNKADIKALQQEIEKNQLKFSKETIDLKHNHDIALRELRVSMENDKKRSLNEQRRHLEQEKQKAVDEAKKKQWCANCGREALFYCCWNTSYCGYSCQEDHWPSHMGTCTQNNSTGAR